MPTLTLPSESRDIRVSSGAAKTARTVTVIIRVKVRVIRRLMNASPRSGSSFSARTSSGMTRLVSTAPSTSSVMRFGRVLAVLKAEPTSTPSAEPMSTVRRKPVIRLSSVAKAMEPVVRTTSASLGFPSAAPSASAVTVVPVAAFARPERADSADTAASASAAEPGTARDAPVDAASADAARRVGFDGPPDARNRCRCPEVCSGSSLESVTCTIILYSAAVWRTVHGASSLP